ncbi:fatty acid desaturase [Oscillatoria sp. CS-180]|uniref:fatty acid desaturase n=1 Tax=Oscillatoria sp. CS-180 TaxID=3021720 RepID=UPI00232F967C|nr:fatty acid desaturase [Oscillatoria sp. CS-180]MDB9527284.1 fatty acid desaturase [Oscillatoria sp. CS-180]
MTATLPPTAQVSTLADPSLALSDLKLSDVIRTIPKSCFEKDWRKAWLSVLVTVIGVVIGYCAIAFSPWYLLPVAWFFTGTAATGLFVVGHDCGHRSFAKKRWVNDWVGHITMMPLVYPFHCWRILHDHHHVHTNKLHVDNAWEPWTVEAFQAAPSWLQMGYRALRGVFWWTGSIAHWAVLHFKPENFSKRDRPAVKVSIAVVAIFAAIFFPTMYFTLGLWGIVKFWLMPWLGYHFWMSTFTIVHHTIPEIQFHPKEQWSAVPAQLSGTVHCTYPKWVEVLCHDINVHVPHHISVGIPSYNLRAAHRSLVQNWGEYIHTRRFSWQLMTQITQKCHLYDADRAYRPFDSLR